MDLLSTHELYMSVYFIILTPCINKKLFDLVSKIVFTLFYVLLNALWYIKKSQLTKQVI